MLQLIHISDTHFGPTKDLTIRDAPVYDRAVALVEAINALPFQPDLIVHTGDVANDPDIEAYRLAESVLSQLKAPVFYATGNHDDVPMMRDIMTFGDHTSLIDESEDRLCYRVDGFPEYDLIIIDGKVPQEEGPHGHISDSQFAAFRKEVSGDKPTAIFIHYPLTPIGSKWIDQFLLVTNGEDFQDMARDTCGANLRGVFSGHLHRGLQLFRGGVLQSGVSSPACEFSAGPNDDTCEFLPGGPIPFNHVTITPEATMVKSYSLHFTGAE